MVSALAGAFAGALSCAPAGEGGARRAAPPVAAASAVPTAPMRAPIVSTRWGEQYRELTARATEAYQRRDWAAFVEASEQALAAFPGHPVFLYNLACAYGVSGRAEDAARLLDELTTRHVFFDGKAENDFAPVRENPAFARAAARLEAVARETRPGGEIAFALPERDLLVEGVAHDPASGSFFVGSVHRRKIVRLEVGKAPRDFVAEGLLGVFGLDVDVTRGLLWACTGALPAMTGYRDADRGRAEALAFDLRTGVLARRVVVATEGKHVCNDLAVLGEGELLVSDSLAGEVLRVVPGVDEPRPFLPAGVLVSPQAIAVSREALFVADYSLGLVRVDRASGEVALVAAPAEAVLTGIDGLRIVSGGLVAIQNGVTPHRVVALTLAPGGRRVERARVLAQADPRWAEPTLGTVVGGALYYVANSQWPAFGRDANPAPETLAAPILLKLAL